MLVASLVASLIGCALAGRGVPDPGARRRNAEALAEFGGFVPIPDAGDVGVNSAAPRLPLAAWVKRGADADCVHVYLEGDGLAWLTRRRVSPDPTPVDPVGLKLALADRSNATLVYLARPCQYEGADALPCRPIVWTAARFGEENLDAMNERLDGILRSLDRGSDARQLTIVGFSGGGVVATLLAARRDDVDRLVTIAAPLDADHWTHTQGVSPLELSLSPMDEIESLRDVEQDHYVGLEDAVVPPAATERFHEALGETAPSRLHRIAGVGHDDWAERASELLGPEVQGCGAALDDSD